MADDRRIVGCVYEDGGETYAWILVRCATTETPGLVVTDDRTLTHLPTGTAVATFRTKGHAERAARALGEITDWTQDSPIGPDTAASVIAAVEATGGLDG